MRRLSSTLALLCLSAAIFNCGGSENALDAPNGSAAGASGTGGEGGTSAAGTAGAGGTTDVGGSGGTTDVGGSGGTAAEGGSGGTGCAYVACGEICCEAGEFCDNGTCAVSTGAFDGYTLYSPNGSREATLVDIGGTIVHTWQMQARGGYSTYLLENGHLLRPAEVSNAQLSGGASAGKVQEVDWNGSVVWEFEYSSSTYLTHHDIEPMPNGNVLLIAWEVKSATEASAAGRTNAATIWPDHIIEVEKAGSGGNIVWEWHAWDHLIQDASPSADNYGVVADHPELIDVNLGSTVSGPGGPGGPPGGGGGDWLHINGISYNPELDQIAISSHFMDEVYVIDHSTTTAEAASHAGGNAGRGGDILYRWGNPTNYDTSGTQVLDVVHSAYWVPAGLPGGGNLMMFNNNETSHASEIIELELPLQSGGTYARTPGTAFAPNSAAWSYEDGATFYSMHLGGVQRLPNGNTLIIESTDSGHMFEVMTDGSTVWEYQPSTEVARALRYAPDYPGLSGL